MRRLDPLFAPGYTCCVTPLPVLFENREIIVVNKPAGLASQGGARVIHSVDTVLAAQTGATVFPVHRLDRDTAGILVVAKTSEAARFWTRVFAARGAVKEYEAFCVGALPRRKGALSTPAGRRREKDALTEYTVTQVSAGETVFSAARLTLCTGRTHQLRMQLADAGCPVVGDDKYGDFQANRRLRKAYGIRKLQLAAVRLTLTLDNKPLTLEIPLPEHMLLARAALFPRPAA
jgi:23S rRNA pseudouridine955/2504/2580 synthase